ncbi:MAG: hypothetical protein RL141_823 [Candidatus Parcubacteria bacterium]|jgi:hypothetical protein
MNIVTKILCYLVSALLFSACGQAITPAAKAPVFGESDIVVPSLEERVAQIQLEAISRPQTEAATTEIVVQVANDKPAVSKESPTKIFGSIDAHTHCLWGVTGRADLGRFDSKEAAYEAGMKSLPPIPENVDGTIEVFIGINQVCGAKQEYAAL